MLGDTSHIPPDITLETHDIQDGMDESQRKGDQEGRAKALSNLS